METVISAVVGASSQTAPSPSMGLQAVGNAIVKHAASSFVRPPKVPGLAYGSSNGVAIIPEAVVPLGAGPAVGGKKQTKKNYKPVQDMLKEYGITLVYLPPTGAGVGVGNDKVEVKLNPVTGMLTVNGVSAPTEKILDKYCMTPADFNELMEKAGVKKKPDKNSQSPIKGVTKKQLEDFGWKDSSPEFVSSLNDALKNYNITSKDSIALFMATMAAESGWGKYTLEYGSDEYFANRPYSKEERGAGYIQITFRSTHLEFLESVHDDFRGKDTATYIADKYPMEAAAWFWSNADKSAEGNLNAYVSKYGSGENVFLISQYFINGMPKGIGNDLSDIRAGVPYKIYDGKLHVNGHTYRLPQGWDDRLKAYQNAINAFVD